MKQNKKIQKQNAYMQSKKPKWLLKHFEKQIPRETFKNASYLPAVFENK